MDVNIFHSVSGMSQGGNRPNQGAESKIAAKANCANESDELRTKCTKRL